MLGVKLPGVCRRAVARAATSAHEVLYEESMKWHLQILRTTWVLWGYGPRAKGERSMHIDRALVQVLDFEFPFELPERSKNLLAPQEHERRIGYGWRWDHEDAAGHSWRFAESPEECIAAAKRGMEQQRFSTQRVFAEAIKDVRITDELEGR